MSPRAPGGRDPCHWAPPAWRSISGGRWVETGSGSSVGSSCTRLCLADPELK